MKAGRQMRLSLEADTLWEQIPTKIREPCTSLLAQMLKTMLALERMEEASDERKADNASS